jgi:hypothetical protein
VRLMLGEDLGRYGAGVKHLHGCLRRLALVGPQPQNGEVELRSVDTDHVTPKDENVFAEDYAIVLTTAPPGSIPARVWRASHVIHV